MNYLEGNPEVIRFTRPRLPKTPAETEARLKIMLEKQPGLEPMGFWAAELLTGPFVGWFMLLPGEGPYPELGYMLVQEYWGRGLATELGEALVKYAFEELKQDGLSAVTDANNPASVAVLEKLGFQFKESTRAVDSVLKVEIEAHSFELKRN